MGQMMYGGADYVQETSEELGRLIKALTASSELEPIQAAVVRDAHK